MTSVELPRVAGAVLELKLGTPVLIQSVVPVHVEVKVTDSSQVAQTNELGRSDRHNPRSSSDSASDSAISAAAAAAVPAGSIVFEPAYLCLGQGAVWFVDRAIDDLLRPSMGPIPYTQIERVDVQKPSECPQTLCIHLLQVRLGEWAPDADKLFIRTADRAKLVSQLQLFWSISHVQMSWTLPGSNDVVIHHDVSWETRRSSLDEDTVSGGARPASLRPGGGVGDKQRQTNDDIAALSSNSTPGAELNAPEHEGFEQIGEYRFCVPRAGSSSATSASTASMGSQISSSKHNNWLSNTLRCLHLTRTSQHFNRISYSSVAAPPQQDQILAHQSSLRRNGSHLSSAGATRGGPSGSVENGLQDAWLLEIATLPVAKVAHDSYAGNASIRLLAEAELRRITAGISEYELLDVPHTYIKKLNLGNDPAQWSCWEISARLWRAKVSAGPLSETAEHGSAAGKAQGGTLRQTVPYSSQPTAVECRDVNIIAMRRMFIPPFMDTLQDFVLVMFSPTITASTVSGAGAAHWNGTGPQGNGSSSDKLGGARTSASSFHRGSVRNGVGQKNVQVFNARRAEITSQSLLEVSRGIADSFMPQSAQHAVDTSIAEAKANALVLGEQSYAWFYMKGLTVEPECRIVARLFCRSLLFVLQAAHLTDNVAPDVALRGCKPADVERFNPDGSRDDPFHWALLMEDMAPESDSDVTGMEAASGSSDGWRRADAVTLKRSAWVQRVWRYLAFCFDGGLALGPTVSLEMLAKKPLLERRSRLVVERVLDWMLHLRPRTEPYRWATLSTKTLDESIVRDMSFNERVMCTFLDAGFVRRIILRDCDATCFIVFLVHLFKYCLKTPAREENTKELQASICRQMLSFAHHSKEEGQRSLSDKTPETLQQEEMSMLVLLPEITSVLRGLRDPTMKTYLVAVLVEFTFYQTRMKNELMKQGGAAIVASFLRSPNSDLVRQSCALLVNCSVQRYHAQIIRSYGCIPDLLRLVNERPFQPYFKSPTVLTEALCVLRNLAKDSKFDGNLRDEIALGLGTTTGVNQTRAPRFLVLLCLK
eukprot:INCI16111.1.p1 GENE.INCI16111.1~~INCI16111.1.p1  ORF type:complete len:1050 (-),score=133.15 INCI16111.1:63-3212(-)